MVKNITTVNQGQGKKISETQSLLEIAKTHTGELRAVAEPICTGEDMLHFRDEIANLVNHLSHDIDEVLNQMAEAAERPLTTSVL
jgi:hypothetical protein